MSEWLEEDNWLVYPTFSEASQEAKRVASLFGEGVSVRPLGEKWKVEITGEAARNLATTMDEVDKEEQSRSIREAELDREYSGDNDEPRDRLGPDLSDSDEAARAEEDGWPYD